ncbi:MAG: deoxyribonuclease IV [Phycisphaerales bacterium]|nr:MAG: deoxyribonuclease IV [Phycisphaerales bacterium]
MASAQVKASPHFFDVTPTTGWPAGPVAVTYCGDTTYEQAAANAQEVEMTMPTPAFGAHRSIAGGFEHAFTAGVGVGCDCLQIFVKNQRQWRAPQLCDRHVAAYKAGARQTGLTPVLAHASYLLNLASPDTATRRKSVHAMVDELERCEALGVSALIFHPGAHLGSGIKSGIKRVARSLDQVHERCPGYRTLILLETTAGQGTAVGHRFEQLAAIIDHVSASGRLGVCLDTCHLFAAGYDFRKPEDYAAMVDELGSVIGLSNVKCIHLNDSKRLLGSRVDRHEHIGKGKIGKRGFVHFVNDKRFAHVPMIIETPKGKDGRGTDLDKVNLKRLRALIR